MKPLPRALAASSPRIVVVGAGLAGLSCAYQLKQAGYHAEIYEASKPGRRPLLDDPQRLRRRPDRRARRRADRPGPQATADIKGIWQQLHKDVSAASYPTLYDLSTERWRELDRMSIVDWINENVPGGITSKLGQLLDVAVYLLAYSGQGQLRIFGPSNEKYHVRSCNDQISTGLADALEEQIHLGMAMSSIQRNGDRRAAGGSGS